MVFPGERECVFFLLLYGAERASEADREITIESTWALTSMMLEVRSSWLDFLRFISYIQRAQYPFVKEYTLNHNIKAPIV